jgi:hypothetical protein
MYGAGINVAAAGYAEDNLSNGGEQVTLIGPSGELQSILFDDAGLWPTAPDGAGKSLEIINPLGPASDPANWRASFYRGGSPGTSGDAPSIAGDFDGDSDVDGSDFLRWQRGVGTAALMGTASAGDADGDRDVDGADLVFWRANFGETTPAAGAASATSAPITDAELVSLAQHRIERTVTGLPEKEARRKSSSQTPPPATRPTGLNAINNDSAQPEMNSGSPKATATDVQEGDAIDAAFAWLSDSNLRSELF